jgi:uridine kinase
MAQILTVVDRKGQPNLFNRDLITEPLLKAFARIKVLPPDKDPKPVAEELTRRVVYKLEQMDKPSVTKDEIVEAHRLVFRELMGDTNGFPMTQRQTLTYMEEFLAYAAGFALIEKGIITADKFTPDGVPRGKVATIWDWNVKHDCHTIEKLNEWVLGLNGKNFAELVRMAEERYAEELRFAAQQTLERGAKVAIFHGPSSSGKTTTAQRTDDFVKELSRNGKQIRWIEVDMYFKDKKRNQMYEYEITGPKTGKHVMPDWDYETPHAYDEPTMKPDMLAVLEGKTVWIPHYDFGKGIVYPKHTKFPPLKDNEILGIDCLHGGSDFITGMIPNDMKIRIYIEAQNTIHDGEAYTRWTDIRLIRRMLRDIAMRGHDTLLSLLHWHLVRKGDLMHIAPLINTAHVLVNGGMPYELPVFKKHAERFFKAYVGVLRANPHLGDALVRCERVCSLFDKVETATEEQISNIPNNSVMREFIGGSIYYPKFPYGLLDTKMPQEL